MKNQADMLQYCWTHRTKFAGEQDVSPQSFVAAAKMKTYSSRWLVYPQLSSELSSWGRLWWVGCCWSDRQASPTNGSTGWSHWGRDCAHKRTRQARTLADTWSCWRSRCGRSGQTARLRSTSGHSSGCLAQRNYSIAQRSANVAKVSCVHIRQVGGWSDNLQHTRKVQLQKERKKNKKLERLRAQMKTEQWKLKKTYPTPSHDLQTVERQAQAAAAVAH